MKFMKALGMALLSATAIQSVAAQELRDPFEWMDRMNRASAVMLVEEGVVTPEQGAIIADAIDAMLAESDEPGFKRSGSYLTLEPRLLELGGAEVSRLHTGRSSIDTGRTNWRLQQRDLLLSVYDEMIGARETLLDFAREHSDAIIPAYTLGVQAQPMSMGHYITGYLGVYERHANLLEGTYDNVNQSPLGSAVLGTSSYPINRQRLSDLLGFDAPVYNSFDSVQLATMETNMRITGATNAIAMTTGELLSDLEQQYRMTKPWLTFPVNMTGGSSIMPQKLNPTGINSARELASSILGHGVSFMFGAHKASAGDTDLMFPGPNEALQGTAKLMDGIDSMFAVFDFHEDRALDEVLADYATATELANSLSRVGGLPFREAHHVAAVMVQYGRDNGLVPTQITFAQFEEVYAGLVAAEGMPALAAAFDEAEFLRVQHPESMVTSSQGLGGPQPAEVAKMIEALDAQIKADREWLDGKRAALAAAEAALDEAFAGL